MKRDRGNILFLILLAIVLFAALSYAVVGSGRVSEDQRISTEKAQAAVGTINNYFSLLENTITRLRVTNGCGDSGGMIQFTNSVVSGYNGGTVECRPFSPNGGGMAWQTPDPSWFTPPTGSEDTTYGVYFFPTGRICILGLGTGTCTGQSSEVDLVGGLNYVTDKVCSAYNAQLGLGTITTTYPLSAGDTKFGGFLTATQYNNGSATKGLLTACVSGTFRGNSIYYVLWAR